MADQVTAEQLKLGMLFPPQSEVLEMAIHTANRRKRIQWPCTRVTCQHYGLGFLGPLLCWCWPRNGS